MKLHKCEAHNFGSYKHLQLDFNNSGLTLVHGPTGAGKSTLPDLACWALFGQTAKDGSVDEVRSWLSEEPTTVNLEVETNEGCISVFRSRGKGTTQNDLYWYEIGQGDKKHRGKDLAETQKNLERRLGITAELYLTGAYFSEFSSTASFFMAKAKDRRAVFERIANMDFAIKMANKTSEHKKSARKELGELQLNSSRLSGRLESLRSSLDSSKDDSAGFESVVADTVNRLHLQSKNFEVEKASKIAALQTKYDRHEADKAKKIDDLCLKLESLESKIKDPNIFVKQLAALHVLTGSCVTCGQPLKSHRDKLDLAKEKHRENAILLDKFDQGRAALVDLQGLENPYIEQIKDAQEMKNHYEAQATAEKKKINPFIAQITKIEGDIIANEIAFSEITAGVKTKEYRLACLDKLYDLSFELRGQLLQKTIKEIENETNRYLETFFDAEIKVLFSANDADNLDVSIQKSGYECVYRQLSKGQRQLLRLCFSLAVMEAASNKAGIHFDNVFMDESLDGMDDSLKIKAFSLLQELQTKHSSVYVIDHCEAFKAMFDKRLKVSMESDTSIIEEESE